MTRAGYHSILCGFADNLAFAFGVIGVELWATKQQVVMEMGI